jgi:hypothetical protein
MITESSMNKNRRRPDDVPSTLRQGFNQGFNAKHGEGFHRAGHRRDATIIPTDLPGTCPFVDTFVTFLRRPLDVLGAFAPAIVTR